MPASRPPWRCRRPWCRRQRPQHVRLHEWACLLGRPESCPASRSAKNRCRIAFDSTDRTQSANSSISRREPLSKSMMRQASMASTAANGARAPRAVLASVARTAWQAAMPAARSPIFPANPGSTAFGSRGARPREGDGAFQQIAVNHGVDDAHVDCPGGSDRLAPCAHLRELRRSPHKPRQPLSAACTRNDSEVHLGLTHIGGAAKRGNDRPLRTRGRLRARDRESRQRAACRRLRAFSATTCPAFDRSMDCSRVASCLKTLRCPRRR